MSTRILRDRHDLWDFIINWPGQVSVEECRLLSCLAADVIKGCIVEIGSYRGKSALALAFGVRRIPKNNRPKIYCIEPHAHFVGYYGGCFGPEDRGIFYNAMLKTQAFMDVSLVNLSSHEIGPMWREPIGLLFVDGDHRYDSVKRDFDYWEPHVLPGGIIAFHDATDPSGGVYKLIKEITQTGRFHVVSVVDSTCVVRKIKNDLTSRKSFLSVPKRILVVVAGFSLNGGLLRFERVGTVLCNWGHEVIFVDLSSTPKEVWEWKPTLPVISLEQALQMKWDAVMVPGAGFHEDFIRMLRIFRRSNFGTRVQHILNDQSRRSRFKMVNQYFDPHIVIFNNEHWLLGSFIDFRGDRFHFLIGAVDTSIFCPPTYRSHPLKPGKWIIGGLASKNPIPLIESLKYLPGDIELWFYGKDTQGINQRYTNLIARGKIRLLGELFNDDLAEFYRNVDCVVMTETEAGWSNLVAEAMASGTPVVCTPHGTASIAYHERTALVLEEPSPKAIAKQVLRLRNDASLCRHLTESARKLICSYSWEEYARKLLTLIRHDGQCHYTHEPSLGLYGKWPLEQRLSGLQNLLEKCSGLSVLDLGSAEGLIAREFLKKGARLVHGFDVEPGMVMMARAVCAGWTNAVFRCSDISNWDNFNKTNKDLLLDKYDIVLYLGVHHHLPQECRRKILLKLLEKSRRYFVIRTPERYYIEDSIEEDMISNGFCLIASESREDIKDHLGTLKIYEKKLNNKFYIYNKLNDTNQHNQIIRHFVSYPKSGRTWIRYILYQLNLDNQINFHHDGFEFNDPSCPPHDFSLEDRIKRYSVVDKLVYLERDPRDVMVSLYAQITGRFKDLFHYKGSISEFIRDEYFGAVNLKKFREMWNYLVKHFGFLKITYEECHYDMKSVISRLIEYYGFNVPEEAISAAVENARFEKMKMLEQSQKFPFAWLRPRNYAPKVRKGKIGSFKEELNVGDIDYLNKIFFDDFTIYSL